MKEPPVNVNDRRGKGGYHLACRVHAVTSSG
jgi:hypothetical protein